MRLAPSRIGIRHQLLGLFGLFLATGALVLVDTATHRTSAAVLVR